MHNFFCPCRECQDYFETPAFDSMTNVNDAHHAAFEERVYQETMGKEAAFAYMLGGKAPEPEEMDGFERAGDLVPPPTAFKVLGRKAGTEYRVFMPVGMNINHFETRGQFEYEQVAVIRARSLQDAWYLCQHIEGNGDHWPAHLRSLCVGDIFQSEADAASGRCHMISFIGFTDMPVTVLSYID